ncbi:MAG: M23 family metallopeptidase [Deltaproteobacteria bacterium]|nr:M23 family metallopeptidase [Deltaproteobacteria bacterium]
MTRRKLQLSILSIGLGCIALGWISLGSTQSTSGSLGTSIGSESVHPPALTLHDDSSEKLKFAKSDFIGPPSPPEPLGPPPPPLKPQVLSGVVKAGTSLGRLLTKQGISSQNIHQIDRGMRSVFDFRNAHSGDKYRLILHSDGSIVDFRYWPNSLVSYHYFRMGEHFVAEREEVELTRRSEVLEGVVSSNFYNAIRAAGESAPLANAFTALFAWDVDFSRDVKPGDQFKILYERFYRTDDEGQEVYVRSGRILAAKYKGANGSHTALHYETADGHSGYYRANGTSIEREFLMSPLEYGRVTSKFTMARKHPILKVTRPHQGIDYAAPEGTPIWAVADGTVVFKGQTKGFGRTIKVRHSNGYISYYTHMSRFKTGLHTGQRVTQKETVGYVGHSGLATGPHVCFRLQKDGRYVNPKKLRSPAGKPIPASEITAFESRANALLAALNETLDGGSDAVAMVAEEATSL